MVLVKKIQGQILEAITQITLSPTTSQGDTIKPLTADKIFFEGLLETKLAKEIICNIPFWLVHFILDEHEWKQYGWVSDFRELSVSDCEELV